MRPGFRLLLALALAVPAVAPAVEPVRWSDKLPTDPAWLAGATGRGIAENLLLYQFPSGGWPKNIDMAKPLTAAEQAALAKRKEQATIDNGATTAQVRFLAHAFGATGEARYRAAAERGLDYLLAAQYPNGGWPQYFPLREGYYTRITFNDGAMVNVLEVLRAVAAGKPPFAWVDEARRVRAADAVSRGTDCILRCQVVREGVRTVWAAQHDEKTFAPAWARKFEPPTLASAESVGVVRFLLGIERPGPEVVTAVEGAVAWFERVKITGLRVEEVPAPDLPKGRDRVAVPDPAAGPLWARFYELETDRPVFMGRDSVVHYRLDEIEHERRIGYAWYNNTARRLLEREYPAWKKRLAP
jgi:PelA/Pel-15E family pectate lyase